MQAGDTKTPISELHLVRQASQVNCKFWCGTTFKGSLTTSDLLASGEVDSALHEAATKGMQDSPPLLISENNDKNPYFLYFFQTFDAEAVTRSLGHLEGFLKGQEVDSLGIYIPDLKNQGVSTHTLYMNIIQQLVQHLGLQRVFVLIEPSRYDQTLSDLLAVKSHLEKEKISLVVYH